MSARDKLNQAVERLLENLKTEGLMVVEEKPDKKSTDVDAKKKPSKKRKRDSAEVPAPTQPPAPPPKTAAELKAEKAALKKKQKELAAELKRVDKAETKLKKAKKK